MKTERKEAKTEMRTTRVWKRLQKKLAGIMVLMLVLTEIWYMPVYAITEEGHSPTILARLATNSDAEEAEETKGDDADEDVEDEADDDTELDNDLASPSDAEELTIASDSEADMEILLYDLTPYESDEFLKTYLYGNKENGDVESGLADGASEGMLRIMVWTGAAEGYYLSGLSYLYTGEEPQEADRPTAISQDFEELEPEEGAMEGEREFVLEIPKSEGPERDLYILAEFSLKEIAVAGEIKLETGMLLEIYEDGYQIVRDGEAEARTAFSGSYLLTSDGSKEAPVDARVSVKAGEHQIALEGLHLSPEAGAPFSVEAEADVQLLLKDGSENSFYAKAGGNAGLEAEKPLEILCEGCVEPEHRCGDQCGMLQSTGDMNGAGIGGGNGGAGTVTINGGTVTASSYYGAGIGGGYGYGGAGTVTINGGMVTASSDSGAGIGGGNDGKGTVTINGGTVTASSVYGVGIGGEGGGTVTINGGTVTASGGSGVGIGGEGGEKVTINGGSIWGKVSAPVNRSGLPVYPTPWSGGSANEFVSLVFTIPEYYGVKDLKTNEEGKLRFFLPEGKIVLIKDGVTYAGEVKKPTESLVGKTDDDASYSADGTVPVDLSQEGKFSIALGGVYYNGTTEVRVPGAVIANEIAYIKQNPENEYTVQFTTTAGVKGAPVIWNIEKAALETIAETSSIKDVGFTTPDIDITFDANAIEELGMYQAANVLMSVEKKRFSTPVKQPGVQVGITTYIQAGETTYTVPDFTDGRITVGTTAEVPEEQQYTYVTATVEVETGAKRASDWAAYDPNTRIATVNYKAVNATYTIIVSDSTSAEENQETTSEVVKDPAYVASEKVWDMDHAVGDYMAHGTNPDGVGGALSEDQESEAGE
ncbi:MAG: hypothetical protein PHV18_03875 [Lachnospiraceae bacterium]|nr:hypothetical protein [Lachnospiraceae bacterium]